MRVWAEMLTASCGPTRVYVQCRQLTPPAQLIHTVNTFRLPEFFSLNHNFFRGRQKKPKHDLGLGYQICQFCEGGTFWAVAASSFLPQSCQRQ